MWKAVGCLGFTDGARIMGEFAHASLRTLKLKFLSSSEKAASTNFVYTSVGLFNVRIT